MVSAFGRGADPIDDELLAALLALSEDEIADFVDALPEDMAQAVLEALDARDPDTIVVPPSPLEQAQMLDPKYRALPHLRYLSERLVAAIEDVEAGKTRFLCVFMPPRSGKTAMVSEGFVAWALRRHPDWPMILVSHSPSLANSWGRFTRRLVAEHESEWGFGIAPDAGAVGEWETTKGSKVLSRSIGGQISGEGAKVLVIDDPVKDRKSVESITDRDNVWSAWTSTLVTRLNRPALVVLVMTRWHQDDLAGRLLSAEWPGDPADWEVIDFPAIAEDDDVLGRHPGEPLYSATTEADETAEEALERWKSVEVAVGPDDWASLFQQRPAARDGSIYRAEWFRYWTYSKSRADADPERTVYVDPDAAFPGGVWVDSWDMTFKGPESAGDYFVGQRWVRVGPDAFLVAQHRSRKAFTEALETIKEWCKPDGDIAYSGRVFKRLIELSANGHAIVDVLTRQIPGVVPVKATDPKEVRARAITPWFASKHVFFPHPAETGNAWVQELKDELLLFPNGAHDDMNDALVQALTDLRAPGFGGMSNPNSPHGNGPVDGKSRDGDARKRLQSRLQQARVERGNGR